MWGASVYVWSSNNINYKELLSLQPTRKDSPTPIATGAGRVGMMDQTPLVPQERTGKATVFELPELLDIINQALEVTIVYLITVCLYTDEQISSYLAVRKHTAPLYQYSYLLPLLFAGYFLYKCLHPWADRRAYYVLLYRAVCVPWYPVHFVDSYIGDILTSLVRVLLPTATLILFCGYYCTLLLLGSGGDAGISRVEVYREITSHALYTRGLVPLLTLLPLCIRFLHCIRRSVETDRRWPHWANALKYTSALSVIAVAVFHPTVPGSSVLWVVCFVGATVFQCVWDVFMDWGLFTLVQSYSTNNMDTTRQGVVSIPHMGTLVMRRERLVSESPEVYWVILGINVVLRFSWTLTLVNTANHPYIPVHRGVLALIFHYLTPFIAMVEIIRRMMWGFLRVEWECIVTEGKNSAIETAQELQSVEMKTSTGPFERMEVGSRYSFVNYNMEASVPYAVQQFLISACLRLGLVNTNLNLQIEAIVFSLAVFSIIVWTACV